MTSIITVTLFLPFVLLFLRQDESGTPLDKQGPGLLGWLGMSTKGLFAALILPLLLTCLLFLGPIVAYVLSCHVQQRSVVTALSASFTKQFSGRHLIFSVRSMIFAPICEEVVFRAVIVTIMIVGGFSPAWASYFPPLLFGVAHSHQLIGMVRANNIAFKQAVMQVCFMLSYTTVFGMYVCFLYYRTGHLLAVVLVHAFCNMMGVPDLSFLSPRSQLHDFKKVILASFLVGMLSFYLAIMPLTQPDLYSSWLHRYHLLRNNA